MTITGKHDVYEFIIDGQSGLIPGDVSGKALIAGVCSLGEIGKVYRLGAQSPVRDILGVGPLADAVLDAFAGAAASGGQDSIIIAVPVAGAPGSYIGPCTHLPGAWGTGPEPIVLGSPVDNADIVVEVVTGGAPGVAPGVEVKTSLDNGATFDEPLTLPADGQLSLLGLGVTFCFSDSELTIGTKYVCRVRVPIGPISQTGPGPSVSVSETVLAGAQVRLLITRSGKCNVGQYQLSTDGGDSYGPIKTLPLDGIIKVPGAGVEIALQPTAAYQQGTLYSFELLPPVPTVSTVMEALTLPLERLDPEFVHIVGPSDAVDWAAFSMLAQAQMQRHRPLFITCEARLPSAEEDLDAWADHLLSESTKGAAPLVACCAAFGEIQDREGTRRVRNCGGLLVGRLMSIPVQRHIGRVADGGITPLSMTNGWNDALQVELRDAGFITVQWYEGLNALYWGDDRVLAEATSDYRFLVVIRVVFKALRLMRLQALKSMFDEAGDPILDSEAAGLNYLQQNLEASLDVMVKARPRELAAAKVNILKGQDIVNNGVDCEVDLVGIPIIKRISIHTKYVYAGGRFDPRVTQGGR